MDGAPPLPGSERAGWARDFQAAFDALTAEIAAGREPAIDAYAAEAPEEFFAVCSEYWFTAPDVLRAAMPAVAARLERFYGSPAPP
jgi:Mlc titration factor MtfA (ptsG expression regulator)